MVRAVDCMLDDTNVHMHEVTINYIERSSVHSSQR